MLPTIFDSMIELANAAQPLFRYPTRAENQLEQFAARIYQTDDGYFLELDAPGHDQQDLQVDYSNERITVNSTRNEQPKQKINFQLPSDHDPDSIEAKLTDGVLHIHVAKKQSQAPSARKIAIQSTETSK